MKKNHIFACHIHFGCVVGTNLMVNASLPLVERLKNQNY